MARIVDRVKYARPGSRAGANAKLLLEPDAGERGGYVPVVYGCDVMVRDRTLLLP